MKQFVFIISTVLLAPLGFRFPVFPALVGTVWLAASTTHRYRNTGHLFPQVDLRGPIGRSPRPKIPNRRETILLAAFGLMALAVFFFVWGLPDQPE
jgi:hypothetical protein